MSGLGIPKLWEEGEKTASEERDYVFGKGDILGETVIPVEQNCLTKDHSSHFTKYINLFNLSCKYLLIHSNWLHTWNFFRFILFHSIFSQNQPERKIWNLGFRLLCFSVLLFPWLSTFFKKSHKCNFLKFSTCAPPPPPPPTPPQ